MAEQLVDVVTPGEVESVAEIAPGSGAIIRRGLKKIAAYKDETGSVHELTAICRHRGCIVDWNSLRRRGTVPATVRAMTPSGMS